MQAPAYCFDREPVDGIKGLCSRMVGSALRSPYRSTVPLLSLIEHSRPDWRALMQLLGAPTVGTVHIEYCVDSPMAGRNPSQTDALLMSDKGVWAIEAKWTEPRYETVAKRIEKPEPDGADPRDTVEGWLRYLRPFAACEVKADDVLDVVYQMLHRAASACAVATANHLQPHLVYLHFHPSPLPSSATTKQYQDDLKKLHGLLGNPSTLSFTVVELPLDATSAFNAIKDLDKRKPESAPEVKDALCRGPVFTFGEPVVIRI